MGNRNKSTSGHILDIAEQLVQTRGFNGFSYADVSAEIGISKASLHYHFPTKAGLAKSLVDRYQQDFLRALGDIDARHEHAVDKVNAYVRIYLRTLQADRMCLCGMLAAEVATLPAAIREAVRGFFIANQSWLTAVLSRGRANGELAFTGKPSETAHLLVCALEGAMLIARTSRDIGRFRSLADMIIRSVTPCSGQRSARAKGQPKVLRS